MHSDFDPNGHKNLELFRYYLNRDLTRIEQNIQNSSNELLGYFIASLADMSVVVLFSDLLSGKGVWVKLFAVFALIVLFVLVSKASSAVANWISIRRKESGREEYMITAARQAIIDGFDNIVEREFRSSHFIFRDAPDVIRDEFPYIGDFLLHSSSLITNCKQLITDYNRLA